MTSSFLVALARRVIGLVALMLMAGSAQAQFEIIGLDNGVEAVIAHGLIPPNTASASAATDFGKGITLASKIKRTFKVSNTGTASISVNSVSVSGAGYSIVSGNTGSFVLGAGLSATYEVEFTPQATGTDNGTFIVNDGGPLNQINITGEGVDSPTLAKTFDPTTQEIGLVSKMTLKVTDLANLNVSGMVISDIFPTGIVVANPASATTSTDCPPGTLTATAGQSSVGFIQQSGDESSINDCTITVNVTSDVGGTYTNKASIAGGALGGSITKPNSTIEGSASITFKGPDIDVKIGTTAVTDGQAASAATITTPRGTTANQTITIEEAGGAPLTITSISLSNSNDFQVVGTPPTSVAKSDSETFEIQCLATAVTTGPNHAVTTVTINSNADGAENVFTFPLTCEVTPLPPEVAVKGNGIDIAIAATAATNTGADFGTTALGNNVARTFRIEEVDGDSDLVISATAITGTGFTISANPDGTVTKGDGVDLGVQCSATSAGTFTETVSFTTNDTDDGETSFTFKVECVVASDPPEISVANTGTNVAANSVQTVNPGPAQTYTISNEATAADGADLNISSIASSNTTDFSLSSVSTGNIAGGATSDFMLQCTATVPGTYETTISIANNDATGSEDPYEFKASCTVVSDPPEINVTNSLSGGAINFASTTTLSSAISETITIQEVEGESNLRIDNVTVSNSAEFEVNSHPSLVTADGQETFTLTCKAASIGMHTTKVTITHNDTDDDESPYTFEATCVVENQLPIAVAKALDTNVSEGDTVKLDGTDSSDPDNVDETLTYAWIQTAGTSVTLVTPASAQPTFVAPTLPDNTAVTLTFSLVVTDTNNGVSTNTEEVTVTVNNKNIAPVANAGPDQTTGALAGTTVQLDGSGSSDPDTDNITYLWTAPSGVTLNTPTSQNPTFSAPLYTRDTTLEFTLVVNDGQLDSTSDVVKVLIKEGIKPTVAVADIPNPCTDISPIKLAINFSEDVLGLAIGDFNITNATIISLDPAAGPATNYTLTVQPAPPASTTVTYPVTIELPAGRVTDVAGNDNIALTPVTFTCAHDDYINRRTRGVITNFMLDRATVMLAQEPQLIDQLQRVRRQNTAVDLSASFVEGQSARVEFSTSARQVIGFARQKRAEGRQYDGAPVMSSARERLDLDADSRADVWVRGHWGSANSNDRKTSGGVIYFGGDYRVTDNSVLGAIVQYDVFNSADNQLGYSSNGIGWMAGPYFAAQLFDGMYLDGRFAVGGSVNEVSPFNTYEDKFGTLRGLVRMRATGEIQFDNWAIQPEASFYHFRETADSYVDSLGVEIPESKVSITQIEVGPRVRGQFDLGEEDRLDVMFGLRSVYEAQGGNFKNFTAGLNPDFREGFRGRVDAGIDWHGRLGSVTTELYYDGIGKKDFSSYGAKLRYQVPLQ